MTPALLDQVVVAAASFIGLVALCLGLLALSGSEWRQPPGAPSGRRPHLGAKV